MMLPNQKILYKDIVFRLLVLVFGFCDLALAKTPIYILGLYPITGSWPAGETILAASRLAAEHVNQDSRILRDYELVIIPTDSACNGGRGVDTMYKELYNSSLSKIMIIGAGCSVATEPTAESSHYWNLIQISYAANSPELSYRDMYPRFFRLSLSEYMFNPMRIAVIKHFGWSRVATIHQRADFFSLGDADFRKQAAAVGVEIITSEPFTDDPLSQVNNIKRLDARIILCNSYEPQARKVFCAAWKAGLYGRKYVWIIPAWFQTYWWRIRNPEENIDCTIEQMDEATKGYLGVYQIIFLENGGDDTLSGKSTSDYINGLKEKMGEDVEFQFGFQEAAYGYDTIWTMALALNKTEAHLKAIDPLRSIADFNYEDEEIGNILLEKVTNTKFQGLTGTVQFLDTGDRRGIVKLTQNHNGSEEVVALFDLSEPEGNQLSFLNETQIIWNGKCLK
ncbi:gamma-aminobutyric acid type B receptor subunit 1-like [Amphiura filiformis]|uniref:gamma-aminobutyric acid type B receptor subunit 1-like n=1 Tax=Amphiura filiformis TaxID=82378 RepID=UPI003B20B668